MGPRRIAMLLMLAASQACAQAAQPPVVTGSGKRVFLPPPVQWDNDMRGYRPALQQTRSDFANLTGGITFGMPAADVNARLPEPYPGMSWNALTLANEYPGEVRFFGVPIGSPEPLGMDLTACTGAGSYLVFLFSGNGLFRLSYRLVPDKACASTDEAAQAIFAHYIPIGQNVALSVRYRTGKIQVVDITDPTAGYLTPIRWRQGGN